MTDLVLATRSHHKAAEIREMLGPIPGLRVRDLDEAGIREEPAEADIEAFDTFEANALAKARYFAPLARAAVLADDSGLCVDALDGGPGVFSKRFAGRADLSGDALDLANNDRLLDALDGLPPESRTAHYVCVLALVEPSGRERLFRGTVDGVILERPRGDGGFGYDPLFFVPPLSATFAEVDATTKNRFSHRANALRAAAPSLQRLVGH